MDSQSYSNFDTLPLNQFLDELDIAAQDATPGRYDTRSMNFSSTEEIAKWYQEFCARSQEKSGSLTVWCVEAVDHPAKTPEFGVAVSIPGNGPTSRKNAIFASYATPNNILALTSMVRRLQFENRILRSGATPE
jgi:hypothetical protein